MSFIRCLSNPEALYIYTSVEDNLTWIHHGVKSPLASKSEKDGLPYTFTVPEKDFLAVGRKWAKNWWCYSTYEVIRSGRLAVQEVHVYLDNGKRVKKNHMTEWLKGSREGRRKTEFLIKFSYGKHFVMMWRTTWHYIVHSILDHLGLEDDGRTRKLWLDRALKRLSKRRRS